MAGLRTGFGDDWLQIGAVKYVADGSASERTMRMSTPFQGKPDDFGILTMTPEEVDAAVKDAYEHDFQVAIHANGDVTIAMVRDRLREPDAARGFMLDGFPRTVPQAEVLDDILRESGVKIDVVLELVVDDDEVIRRLSGRRTCRSCNRVWHVDFGPPAVEGVCDADGGELYQRDDDKAETIANRLHVYADQTAPLVNYYASRGVLIGIDATGPVDDVTQRAVDALRGLHEQG